MRLPGFTAQQSLTARTAFEPRTGANTGRRARTSDITPQMLERWVCSGDGKLCFHEFFDDSGGLIWYDIYYGGVCLSCPH